MPRLAAFLCILVVSVLTPCVVFGQYSWMEGYGSSGNDESIDCVYTETGYVTTGYFSGTVDFGGTSLSSSGATDVFVMRHSSAGGVIWAKKLGGSVTERPVAIDVDGDGNLYVTGNFYGTTTLGGTTLTPPDADSEIFVAKYSSAGDLLWVIAVGGANEDIVQDIAVKSDGTFAITGAFRETFVSSATTLSGADYGEDEVDEGDPSLEMFVAAADADGNWLWAQHGTTESDARGLSIDHSTTHFYMVGQFSDTLNFGAQLVNNTVANTGFVAALDDAGEVDWITRMSAGFTQCHDVLVNGTSIYVTGDYIQQMAVFDGDTDFFDAPYDNNIFTASFSNSGSLNWFSSSGSDSQVTSQEISLDEGGDLVIGGHFQCRHDGFGDDAGNGLWRSLDEWDLFVAGYDTSGNRTWERHMGGKGDDRMRGLSRGEELTGPFIAASCTNKLIVPGWLNTNTGEFDAPWCANYASTYCGYDNYGNITFYSSSGGADAVMLFVRFSDYPLLDPYRRTGSDCDLSVGEICFGLESFDVDCATCPDTLYICQGSQNVFAYPPYADMYGLGADMFDHTWPNWDPVDIYNDLGGGTHSITMTTLDGCFEFTSEIELVEVESDCVLLWDELGINEGTCFPDTISVCEADSVLLWAEFPEGEVTDWGSQGSSTPVFFEDGLTSVNVIATDWYHVEGTTEFGCTVSTDVYVEIGHQIPDLDTYLEVTMDWEQVFDGDSLIFCEPEWMFGYLEEENDSPWAELNTNAGWSMFLGDDLIGGYTSYGDTIGDYNQNHQYQYYISQTGTYTLQCIVDEFWDDPCPDSLWTDTLEISFHVTILDAEEDLVTFEGPDYICLDECVEFTVSGMTAYNSTSNIESISDDLSTFTVCEPGYYAIGWEVELEDCAFDGVISGFLLDYPPPVIEAIPDHFVICPGDSVLLTTDPGLDYQWYGPLGEPLGTEQELWVSAPGAYVVGVTNEDGCYLESVAADTYAYNTPYLEYTPDSDLCYEDEVLVSILTSEAADVSWEAPLTGSGLEQIITEAGTYGVSVSFCGITTEFEIEITDTPIDATIQAESFLQCAPGDLVTLWSDSTMFSYDWSTGDEDVWEIQVDTPGDVWLTVMNDAGCVETDTATVLTPADALPLPTSTAACEGTPIYLYSGTEAEVYWSYEAFGSDTLGFGSPFDHPPIDQGTWFYAMHPDTSCGPLMDSVFVEILDGGILTTDSTLCLPSSLLLEAWTTVDGVDVSWSPSSQVADAESLTTAITSNATTDYILELSSENGCMVTDTVTLTQIIETTTLPEDDILCEGDILTLSVPWPDSYTITWSDGQTGAVSVWDSTATISVSVVSPDGCESGDVMELSVLPYPVIPLPLDTTFCETLYLELDIGNEQYDILWDNGDTVPERIIQTPGTVSVEVTNGPCVTTAITDIEMLPMPVNTLAQDTVICFDEPPYSAFLDAGNAGASYTWYNGEETPVIEVNGTDIAWVNVTLPNGCAQVFELEVVEFCEGALYIPNAFTPNQDGHNDVWGVEAFNLLEFEIWVFNRWGEVVYHSLSPDEVWVGDHQGGTHYVPDGVYTYLVKATWPTYEGIAAPRSLTGHVSILR